MTYFAVRYHIDGFEKPIATCLMARNRAAMRRQIRRKLPSAHGFSIIAERNS